MDSDTDQPTGSPEDHDSPENDFISNPNSKRLHRGSREDGPNCSAKISTTPTVIDAETPTEAVLRYNLLPCINCIENHYQLNRWRLDLHSATVMDHVDTPSHIVEEYAV